MTMPGELNEIGRLLRCELRWEDLFLRGMIDGYKRERKRIQSRRTETEKKEAREKEEKREVGKILSMCKEAVRKEVEEVKNKYEEMVSEKDRRINELQRELEEEINGRRK